MIIQINIIIIIGYSVLESTYTVEGFQFFTPHVVEAEAGV